MINRLITYLATLTCIATVVAFLARSWWVFELFSHFRVQYLVILTLCGVVLAVNRKKRESILAICFALVNLFLVGQYEPGTLVQASIGPAQERRLRAVAVNVNHTNREYARVAQFLQSADADFVILLEVNQTWLWNLNALYDQYPYKRLRPGRHNGIALFSRIPFEKVEITTLGGIGRPTVIARMTIGGVPLTLMGAHTHSPSSSWRAIRRNQQLREMAKFVSQQEGTTVLLGDLNITPWSPYFKDFLRHSGLRDSRDGFGVQPTWPTKFFPVWIPIDHGLVSSDVKVHERKVGPDVGSDHYPVVLDFSLRETSKSNELKVLSTEPLDFITAD